MNGSEKVQTRSLWFRVGRVAGGIAVAFTFALVGLILWWTLEPYQLPEIEQPIKVLNADREIFEGEPFNFQLEVFKPEDIPVNNASRFMECESGALVTFASNEVNLPRGEFVLRTDSPVLPGGVLDGDICTFTYRITYEINPIKYQTKDYTTEEFTVRKGQRGDRGHHLGDGE